MLTSSVKNLATLLVVVALAACTGKASSLADKGKASSELPSALPDRLSCANDYPSTWEAGQLHIDFGAGGRPASVLLGNQKMYMGQIMSAAGPEQIIAVDKVLYGNGVVTPFSESITVSLEKRVSENQYIVTVAGRTPMIGSVTVACLGMDE